MDPRNAADRHVPVMRARIVELLAPALAAPGSVFVDATLGMGGHTQALLDACPEARAVGIDRDPQAIALASERLAAYGSRFIAVRAVYDEIADVVEDQVGVGGVQAILFDLGVSSLQLDETDRGFAYRVDAPLDMRMDPTTGPTAADVLNTYDTQELIRILSEYGEERYSGRIARAIVRARETRPFTTSGGLVDLLRAVVPAASQRQSGHPAKRTFQALRIEVNGELVAWERALPAAVESLSLSGRVAVLSYHSLEDRIAKRVFAQGTQSTTPVGLPVELAEHAPYLVALTRGAEVPDEAEVAVNPRAASARLRAAERIRITTRVGSDTQGRSARRAGRGWERRTGNRR